MYFVRPAFFLLLLAICGLDVALTFVLPHQIAYAAIAPLVGVGLIAALGWAGFLGVAHALRGTLSWAAAPIRVAAALCEALTLFVVMTAGMRVLDYLSKGTSLPLADDWLARADTSLGFDWRAYFNFVGAHPGLHGPMTTAYLWLNTAAALLMLGLAIAGRHGRVRQFAEAGILCGAVCLIGGAFFPAIGAAAHWIPDYPDPQSHAGFAQMPGIVFVNDILALRRLDTPMQVGTTPLLGLVSMPSMHTAVGVLMIAVARRTWLFWPAFGYGTVMISATPVWGGHYLVDLIAGAALALASAAVVAWRPRSAPEDGR